MELEDARKLLDAVGRHRAELIAMCPPPPPTLSNTPIEITRRGSRGPRVIVVHGGVQGGLGGGPATFAAQELLGERGWRLEFVTRPGFAGSPSRGVDDMELDAVWIADLLGEGAHLVGHSWGGTDVLLAAARNPSAVRSLVLIEPALHPLLTSEPPKNDPALHTEFVRTMEVLLTSANPAEYALGMARNLGTANQAQMALQARPDVAHRSGCALLLARMATPARMREAARDISLQKIPTLVITGGWSPTYDAVGELAARLTGGRHQIVQSPDHFVMSSSPESVNAAMDAFWREDRIH